MNRLSVRLGLIISAYFLVMLVLPLLAWTAVQGKTRRDALGAQTLQDAPADPSTMIQPTQIIPGIPDLFVFMTLGVGVVGAISGVLIGRSLSKPIDQLANAAQIFGKGDLNYRTTIKGSQEINELAEALNRMAADLESAEQLRQNLIADVAHELRTPLTVLEGQLRAALDQVYELDEREIANLYGQTQHLIRLVKDLSLLAQAEAKQLPLVYEDTDIAQLIQETLTVFTSLASEKGVVLDYQHPNELSLISVDAARIRQVLHNLLSNALHYTPERGTITVRALETEKDIQIVVQDTGEGIDPDHLPYIFDRFYRADRSRSRNTGGTGLGLSIAKAIVEAHNGRVTVSSPGLGEGSTFRMFLPLKNV